MGSGSEQKKKKQTDGGASALADEDTPLIWRAAGGCGRPVSQTCRATVWKNPDGRARCYCTCQSSEVWACFFGVTKLWLHVGPEKSVWRSKEPTLAPNERMHQMSKRTETHLGDNLGVGVDHFTWEKALFLV